MPASSSTPLIGQRPGALLWTMAAFLLYAVSVRAVNFPSPVGHVNDFAAMLSSETVAALEQRLQNVKQQTGIEIAVATIESLGGDAIESVAEQMFQQWGIGKSGKDNGALLLIAKQERQSRIEVGYGLEGVLTDIGTSRIQREILVPAFQKGEFDRGVVETIEAIERAICTDAEVSTPSPCRHGEGVPSRRPSHTRIDPLAIFYGIVIAASWVASVLARSKSWWAGGVIGAAIGLLGGLLLSGIAFALGSAAILALLGAVFDYFVSRDYEQRRRLGVSPHWWAGGSGWHHGGWGSGGGFGGGHSGGGGSSARW